MLQFSRDWSAFGFFFGSLMVQFWKGRDGPIRGLYRAGLMVPFATDWRVQRIALGERTCCTCTWCQSCRLWCMVDSPSSHLKNFETLLSFHLKIEFKVECSRGFYLLLNCTDWKFYFFKTIVDLIKKKIMLSFQTKTTHPNFICKVSNFSTIRIFFCSSFIWKTGNRQWFTIIDKKFLTPFNYCSKSQNRQSTDDQNGDWNFHFRKYLVESIWMKFK